MEQIFQMSLLAGLTIIILPIIFLWLFLYSVIKTAVKNGTIAAYKEIEKENHLNNLYTTSITKNPKTP